MNFPFPTLIVCIVALLAAPAADAQTIVNITAARGAVVADSVSLGSYLGTTSSYIFQGTTWNGDASFTWQFPAEAIPGILTDPLTLTYGTNSATIPFQGSLPLGGAGFSAGAGTVAPIFPALEFLTGSLTLTPTSGAVRFSGTGTGNVVGSGTFTMTVSGTINADFTVAMNAILQLTDVSPTIYGGSTLTNTARVSGVVPEPSITALFMLGLGSLLLPAIRRKSHRIG